MNQSPKDFVTPHGQEGSSSDPSLVCWWCVHALPSGEPIHLPIKYETKLDRFSSIGNFCSWACAKAYALDMRTSRSGEIQSFLAMMKRRATGKYTSTWPAPKREALKCFGGSMSIEEFRTYGDQVEPPRVHYPFEKLYFASSITANGTTNVHASLGGAQKDAGKLRAIETAASETETLKLKRNKPLIRSASKLENALGIKRKEKS